MFPQMDDVLRDFRANSTDASRSLYSDAMGFYHAVNWTERWLHALAGAHVLLWALIVATRRATDVQMVLLFVIRACRAARRHRARDARMCTSLTHRCPRAVGMVYSAERLNSLGSQHWREFASQDYFDKHGVFISLVFSAPLLGAAFFILVNALLSASRLLVEVKKREIRAKGGSARRRAKKED